MTTYVAANTGTPRESAAETWPQNMTLMLTNEPIVSMVDLQAWMRRSKPLLCQFTLPPPPDIQDATSNTHSYQKLFQYVTSKPFYTVAAWTLPSGKHCNNVIFVALNKIGLIGAFFPRTGIPEMPKPLPPGSSQVDISTRTPPMTPEQREAVLTQIKRRWDFQLQQFRFLKMRLHTARGKQQHRSGDVL
ncbi:hypothetical protein BDZ94DRAFT_573851 [Collybia nuda]|uniref:Uncharacterized protein n=1 Tax=Collybia nuda TaxID=64659 RepID=A0A9P6CF90_9AGAR|nr:hypothetical protein BDZ94DRAFT_573851 [Collybia nuda]